MYIYIYVYIHYIISLALAWKNQVKVEFLWKSSPFLYIEWCRRMPPAFSFESDDTCDGDITNWASWENCYPFQPNQLALPKKCTFPEIEWQVTANSKQPNFFSIATTITVISTSKTVQPLWLLWVLPFYASPSVVRLPGCVSVVLARLWAAAGRSLRTSFHL